MKQQEFNEAEVQQILARAVQLDASTPEQLRVDQVRAIATELGVSQAALDRALAEYAGNSVAVTNVGSDAIAGQERWWSNRRNAILVLLAALLLAMIIGSRLVVEGDEPADVNIEVGF